MKFFDARAWNLSQIKKNLKIHCQFLRKNQDSISKSVREIFKEISSKGNEAICRYAKKLDNLELSPEEFLVSENLLEKSQTLISKELKLAIDRAYENIKSFSLQNLPKNWRYQPKEGVILGEKFSPLRKVLCYIPSGTAPLISTVLHTATLAKIAGVKDVILTTLPQKNKEIHPAILYLAHLLGIKKVYRLSGVYAIAAFTFGTESVVKVDKIVGPGNAYVAEAKRQAYGFVDIDMIAGPSELMILADDSVPAKFIAADLLAQAEHGSGKERLFLLSSSSNLLSSVKKEIILQKKSLNRLKVINKVLDDNFFLIQTSSHKQMIDFANEIAPEHLELMLEESQLFLERVTQAGAIFWGNYTPESVGDYIAGPSHVLPTGGTAHFFSGLTVEQFFKRTSLVHYEKKALALESKHICLLAKTELLQAHSQSVKLRFENQ